MQKSTQGKEGKNLTSSWLPFPESLTPRYFEDSIRY